MPAKLTPIRRVDIDINSSLIDKERKTFPKNIEEFSLTNEEEDLFLENNIYPLLTENKGKLCIVDSWN